MVIESSYLSDNKNLIKERIIPWEGLARANVISEDDGGQMKILEKQSPENKKSTILSELPLYTNLILNLLNKLAPNSRDDVLKNILVLINDLLLSLPNQEFINSLCNLSDIDPSLPFEPFLKHSENHEPLIKALSLYNLTILLTKVNFKEKNLKVDKEILIKVFQELSSSFIANSEDQSLQFIGIQLLQELVTVRPFKEIYRSYNLVSNFRPISEFIFQQASYQSPAKLNLLYNFLLTTWILSFSSEINYILVHHFPDIVGSLLAVAKDSIKVKVARVAVSILKNFVTLTVSSNEHYKIAKIVLLYDGLNSIKVLQERKYASSESDQELSDDLATLHDELSEVVSKKLTSFDEYLTELQNPKLISWSLPTHRSEKFWNEFAPKFKESSFKLTKTLLEILSSDEVNETVRVIMLNDLQHLIKVLGDDITKFINNERNGHYKILIMDFLVENNGKSELKYEALKTVQMLLGQET